jgi:hypothetical protein
MWFGFSFRQMWYNRIERNIGNKDHHDQMSVTRLPLGSKLPFDILEDASVGVVTFDFLRNAATEPLSRVVIIVTSFGGKGT